ncbi:MAG: DUF349 domain-containing protein [Flavobacteriia bacterium]|nr:DUF349 domain-containing protein [Flavobacteriia bacterium]
MEINYIEHLKKLVENEDLLSVNHEINQLKTDFQDYILEQERQQQINLMEASSENQDISIDLSPIKEEFFNLYNSYKDKKTKFLSAQKIEQESNLRLKKNLIERMRKLIQEEENIGSAVAQYKEIHEQWKNIGDIPREFRQDVQNEFSKLLESFFYTLKIYRELKEHDLKRNTQLKRQIIEKLVHLNESNDIKELENTIKLIQNEFEEIGPVLQLEWEEIKNLYWENVKKIYQKIQLHYEDRKVELAENINEKKKVLEECILFNQQLLENQNVKYWEEKTNELLAFQNKWKEIGFGTRKENEELWQLFRGECDTFFSKKKAFYNQLKEKNKEFIAVKKQLIEKVKNLKDSEDWKKTTDEIIQIQKKWKTLESAGPKMDQLLWREFRGVCDSFFNKKQKHFEESEKEFENNLRIKLDLINRIDNYQISEDKSKSLQDIKEFSQVFLQIGKVPFKEKENIFQAYKKAMDDKYAQLKLEGDEKEKVLFQAKLDNIKANPEAEKLMKKENFDIKQKIQFLNQEITQFENNLGFFARSKGADQLRKEVESKIQHNRNKIKELQIKLKMLNK